MLRGVLAALACALSVAAAVAVIVAVIALDAGEAAACATAPPPGLEVQIADEEAIILWDPATRTEHFIRRAQFRGTARSFGFLVPTPATPQLGEVSDGVFASMADRIRPEIRYERETKLRPSALLFEACVLMKGESAQAPASAPPDAAVRVIATAHVAGFDATTLEADDAGALSAWLGRHGFAATPALTAWLERYVAQKWKLTAFVVATDEVSNEAGRQPRYDVATRAVRMSFPTDRPFYPYREPAPDAARDSPEPSWPRILHVHFLSTERYAATLGNAPWLARILYAAPIEPGLPELAGLGDHLRFATTFVDESNPRPATDELYFAPSPDRTIVRQPPVVITEPNDIVIPIDLLALGLIIAVVVVRRRRARAALLPSRAPAPPGGRPPGPPGPPDP
jgi:Uncharacterized protein conserved in bacteria (DUF2330)